MFRRVFRGLLRLLLFVAVVLLVSGGVMHFTRPSVIGIDHAKVSLEQIRFLAQVASDPAAKKRLRSVLIWHMACCAEIVASMSNPEDADWLASVARRVAAKMRP